MTALALKKAVTAKHAFRAFYAERGGPEQVDHPARRLHEVLVDGVLETAAGERQRRPSLAHDGTPVVYSLKLRRSGPEPLRVLVEPGGLALSVSSQIDHALALVQTALAELGWLDAASDITRAVRCVLPSDRAVANGLWGGIWLGAVISDADTTPELRLYLNLRHGSVLDRWRRVAELLALWTTEPLSPAIRGWLERTALLAIPVGVGLVVADGRLRGVRVYAGVCHPTSAVLAQLAGAPDDACGAAVDAIADSLRSFERHFGTPGSQRATAGFDFVRTDDGELAQALARAKVDLCCQHFEQDREPRLAEWARGAAARLGLDAGPLETFRRHLTTCWGGWRSDFYSLGQGSSGPHLTAYARPSYPPVT